MNLAGSRKWIVMPGQNPLLLFQIDIYLSSPSIWFSTQWQNIMSTGNIHGTHVCSYWIILLKNNTLKNCIMLIFLTIIGIVLNFKLGIMYLPLSVLTIFASQGFTRSFPLLNNLQRSGVLDCLNLHTYRTNLLRWYMYVRIFDQRNIQRMTRWRSGDGGGGIYFIN